MRLCVEQVIQAEQIKRYGCDQHYTKNPDQIERFGLSIQRNWLIIVERSVVKEFYRAVLFQAFLLVDFLDWLFKLYKKRLAASLAIACKAGKSMTYFVSAPSP